MNGSADFSVWFWGVRSSIACPGPETARFGGNTSCVEVRYGDSHIILDAGTGIRPLGDSLDADAVQNADILLSHTHIDHIVGLPLFAPAYRAGNSLRLWAGHLAPPTSLRDALCAVMSRLSTTATTAEPDTTSGRIEPMSAMNGLSAVASLSSRSRIRAARKACRHTSSKPSRDEVSAMRAPAPLRVSCIQPASRSRRVEK